MGTLRVRSVLKQLNLSSLKELETVTEIRDSRLRRQLSRGLIVRHHERVGGIRGRLGMSMGDLRPAANGFLKPYAGGLIELLDVDTGPQGFQRFRAEVRFVGFRCHQQSESPLIGEGDGDEPYFIIGIRGGTSDSENVTKTFGPFEFVRTGQNMFIGEMVTTTVQPPFTIHVTGREHDSGSPDEASAAVEKALNDASAKLTLTLAVLGQNPAIGAMVQSFVNIFGGVAGDVGSALFGMGDDTIGQNFMNLLDYDLGVMDWRNPKPQVNPDFDKPFNVELVLADGDAGRYSVFFQVQVFNDVTAPIAVED